MDSRAWARVASRAVSPRATACPSSATGVLMPARSSESMQPPSAPAALVIPPGEVRNMGTTPSRHWVLTLPSGFEQFYSRCAARFAKGPPNPQEIRAIAAHYGYEFLGPAPEPTGQGASGLGGTA